MGRHGRYGKAEAEGWVLPQTEWGNLPLSPNPNPNPYSRACATHASAAPRAPHEMPYLAWLGFT